MNSRLGDSNDPIREKWSHSREMIPFERNDPIREKWSHSREMIPFERNDPIREKWSHSREMIPFESSNPLTIREFKSSHTIAFGVFLYRILKAFLTCRNISQGNCYLLGDVKSTWHVYIIIASLNFLSTPSTNFIKWTLFTHPAASQVFLWTLFTDPAASQVFFYEHYTPTPRLLRCTYNTRIVNSNIVFNIYFHFLCLVNK